MISRWFQGRRRQRILAHPLPAEAIRTLETGLRHFRRLPAEQRRRAEQIVAVMLAEKEWAGAGGFVVTGPMRLLIAGQAAVMASGHAQPYYFDRLQTIVVHERTIRFTPQQSASNPLLPEPEPLAGVAWHRGPVLISWAAFDRERRGMAPGHNVVLHEFAHHLDGLDGHMDGAPAQANKALDRRWYAVTEAEFFRLVGQAERDEATLLDHYGASNRAEFFAVSTECFFELPHELRERHGALYQALADFYGQDPAEWMPRWSAEVAIGVELDKPPRSKRGRRRSRQPLRRRRRQSDGGLPPIHSEMSTADALFTIGLEHLRMGRAEEAANVLSRVISADPEDEEALAHRAIAYLQLDNPGAALADCNAALAIDPDDVDALCVRAELRLDEGKPAEALADLDRAIARSPNDADALAARGRAYLAAGRAKKAIADFDRAASADPYFAEAYLLRGEAFESLGKSAKAEADFARARALDPDIDAER